MPPDAPLAHEAEELAGCEVERDVRLVVGVDDDEVVAIVGAAQERAGVRVVHGQAWIVLEPEVATADAADGRVELDAVDLRLRVIDPECAGGRPGGVPQNRNALERPSEQQARGTHPRRRR